MYRSKLSGLALLFAMMHSVEAFSSPNNRRAFLDQLTTVATAGVAASVLAPLDANAEDLKLGGNIKFAGEDIMIGKAHGTSVTPVQEELRYGVSNKLADKICNFNRHFAEYSGYFTGTSFEETVRNSDGPVTFYDSNSGKPLFVAPIGRSVDEFIEESKYQ